MPVDVMLIAGTRPEAIKLAPVLSALRAQGLAASLVASGQHERLLDQALLPFGIKPDRAVVAAQSGRSLAELSSHLITALDAEIATLRPAVVLVQGDTTTALCGALAAFYRNTPCGHVEAGLRTGRRDAPWPEELNRALADRLCSRLYAPTQGARSNLLAEGLSDTDILVTGQTGVDAARHAARQLLPQPPQELVSALDGARSKVVFATGHRRENQDGGISEVARILRAQVQRRSDLTVVFATHPSERARGAVAGIEPHPHFRTIEPLGYLACLWMLRRADCVVTDSGGLQEEAPEFGTPVLVTRDVTERPEGLEPGFLRLVGGRAATLDAELTSVLDDPAIRQRLGGLPNPYGDGTASARIAGDVAALVKGAGA